MNPRKSEDISDDEISQFLEDRKNEFLAELGMNDESRDSFLVEKSEPSVFKGSLRSVIGTDYVYRDGLHIGTMLVGFYEPPGPFPKVAELRVECHRVPEFLQ